MNFCLPVGMSSYALRWKIQWTHPTMDVVLKTAASCGAQVVQLCDNLAPEELPEIDLHNAASLAADLGISLELGAVRCTLPHLQACLRAASCLKVRVVRMVLSSGGVPGLNGIENSIRACQAELRSRGLILAIENHFDLSPQDLRLLVESIGAAEVGICLDLFNSLYHFSSQSETIACLAPYAKTVHIKDVNIRRQDTGFYIYGCPLGTGRLNLDGLLAALNANGNKPALLVESWMDRLESDKATCDQEEAWLQDSIQFLKQKMNMECRG